MITRLFKITIAAFAVLLLGLMGGFATTVMAEEPNAENSLQIEIEDNKSYIVSNEGLKIGDNDIISWQGPYVFFGSANSNISFVNDTTEEIIYDVAFHVVEMQTNEIPLRIDTGVKLNLYIYGWCSIHSLVDAGVKINDTGNEKEAKINVITKEDSSLSIGSRAEVDNYLPSQLVFTVEEGECEWMDSYYQVFVTNGYGEIHNYSNSMIDKEYCTKNCNYCTLINVKEKHKISCSQVNSLVHSNGCENCEYFVEEAHDYKSTITSELDHETVCTICLENIGYELHTLDNKGCTKCHAPIVLKHKSEDGTEKQIFFFEVGINYAKQNGGTLILNCDYNANGVSISCTNTDYTFDLNGYTLDGSNLFIGNQESLGKITLIDTSEGKTGFLSNNGLSNTAYGGGLIIDGARVEAGFSIETASCIIKNVVFDLYNLEVDDNGKIQVIDSSIDCLYLHITSTTGSIEIKGGFFNEIELTVIDGQTLKDVLCEGYAYEKNGQITDGNVVKLEKVKVVKHTHDFDNGYYKSWNGHHLYICACGEAPEGETKEAHTNENGICPTCKKELFAKTEIDGEVLYHDSMETAFDYLYNSDKNCKITLLADGEIENSIYTKENISYTIDLNGYSVTIMESLRITTDAEVIILDSSESKNGAIYAERINFTCINVYGRLIFNSGKLVGIIDGFDDAEIIINGGIFAGSTGFCLYDNSNVTINGGAFEGSKLASIMTSNIEAISIRIYGGSYQNGVLISVSEGNYIFFDGLIPADNQCEICFVDGNGNAVIYDSEHYEYNEYLRAHHKNSEIVAEGNHHRIACKDCELVYVEEEHCSYVYLLSQSDKAKHDTICGVCEYELNVEEHTGGEANCSELAKCKYCQAEYGELSPDNHLGGEAYCISRAVCEKCDKEYGELKENNHDSNEVIYIQSKDDSSKHCLVYKCCEKIIDTGSHENGVATCLDRAVCTECGLEYGEEPQGHKYTNDCDISCDSCGKNREIDGHKYDNSCDTECNECRATREIKHIYNEDGKCLTCGDELVVEGEAKANMGIGAIIGITLGSIAIFGGGTFLLIWFVLRKKF